jgi:putative tricarboxylic transport membrane protein
MPIVGIVGFVGIYSLSHSLFDLYLMIAFGVGGYILRKLEVPLVPIILGLLLGTLMEENLRRALNISNGDWTVLFQSPLAIGLWIFAIIGLIAPVIIGRFFRPSRPEEPEGHQALQD